MRWRRAARFRRARLEETALLFLRNNRPLPKELSGYANFERLAELERDTQAHLQTTGGHVCGAAHCLQVAPTASVEQATDAAMGR